MKSSSDQKMQELQQARQAFEILSDWMTEMVDPIARSRHLPEWTTWHKELELIREQIERPNHVRIALVGATGAGKSTFLNAVLGQELLPVGVMEPCTAFVTLVRNGGEAGYRVTVEYISETEWRRDLKSFAAFLKPGDTDGDLSEAKRLLNAAKKRIQTVLGIEITERTDPGPLLVAPLPTEIQKVFWTGSRQSHSFVSAKDMLEHLRKLIRGESPLWPLVKQVNISGPYECLQGGLELVDLPGVNDPNEARVEVTREFLRTSPFVWVTFPMVRGLTEDIQTILHEERLLRTLILSGSYDALSLIGTKADHIDAHHAEELGLDPDADLPDIIREYRRQTIAKARGQLERMVRDMASPSDDRVTLDRMMKLAGNAMVHATSAAAYCRLEKIGRLRRDYGINAIEESGIPAIHEHLRRIAQEAGAGFAARMAIERVNQLVAEIEFFFLARGREPSPAVDRAHLKLKDERTDLEARVANAQSEARLRLEAYREQFLSRLTSLLESSVREVRRACQIWQEIPWNTLRAIVNCDGVYKSPSTGKSYNLNSDLTEPLLNQLPVSWERYFTDDLGRVRGEFIVQIKQFGVDFSERASLIVDLLFQRKFDLLESQLAWFREKIELLAKSATALLIEAIAKRRRALARGIPLVARASMLPAYGAAKLESGSGMKRRILGHLEQTAVKSAPPIYDTIRTDLLEGLNELESIMLRLFGDLADTVKHQAKTVEHNAAIDVDEAGVDPEISAILSSVPKVLSETEETRYGRVSGTFAR